MALTVSNKSKPKGRWLSILSYNIQQPLIGGLCHQILGVHTEKSFLSTECLPHACAPIGADIIVFTESFIGSLRHRLIKLLIKYGYKWFTPVVNHNTSKHCNGGVVLLSKYKIVKIRHYEFKAASNVDGLAAKGVLYVEINKEGYHYHILATHLNAYYDLNDSAKVARRWQIMELRQFYGSLNIKRTEPVFVVGDFNIDYDSHEYHVMLELLKSVQPKILPNGSDKQYTYDTRNNEWAKGEIRNTWLDYVMYLKHYKQPKKAINMLIPLKWNGRDLSDHYPVLGIFQF